MTMIAAVSRQGSDLLWGVALGDQIRAQGGVPRSVDFAAAPSKGWSNPMALGELVLSMVHGIGPWELLALHLALVTGSLAVLVTHCITFRYRQDRVTGALVLVVLGGIATFAIARMPSLSLLPFALLTVLLLRQADRPSWKLWLAVPLLGVWGNLHGAVLVGCALLGVHLIFAPGPLLRRVAVGVASCVVVLLATSAGWRTLSYYRSVLNNEAARQHTGLWATPSLQNPLDIVMLLAAVALLGMWLRNRPSRWELVAVTGFAATTVVASRNSVWLMLFLLPLAARGRNHTPATTCDRLTWRPAAAAFFLLLAGVGWQLSTRGSVIDARGTGAVSTVHQLAAGGTVLAVSPVDETFAAAGIQVWAGNPIDAFPLQVQREFLAFLDKGVLPSHASINLVVVDQRLAGRIEAAGWHQVAAVDDLLLFEPPRAVSDPDTGGLT